MRTGQPVLVHEGGVGKVGLWLVYPDRCETDVVSDFVPAGTRAILAGQLCKIDTVWYARIVFSDAQRRLLEFKSENMWLPINELSPDKGRREPSPKETRHR